IAPSSWSSSYLFRDPDGTSTKMVTGSATCGGYSVSTDEIVGIGIAGVSSGVVAGARDKVLAFALSLPETAQDRPWEDDVVVKVRGKIFVFAGPVGSTRLSIKLAESHAHALAIDGAEPTGYGLGRAGWVTAPYRASGVDRKSVG